MIHTREVKFDGSDFRADEFWVSTSPKSDDLIYRHENSINTFDIDINVLCDSKTPDQVCSGGSNASDIDG